MSEEMTKKQLIKRFAEIQKLTFDEAEKLIGDETAEEVLNKIKEFTFNKITENAPHLNRKQRRALAKKTGNKALAKNTDAIADTTKKLNYINLIQNLRELNEKREKEIEENGETTTENN